MYDDNNLNQQPTNQAPVYNFSTDPKPPKRKKGIGIVAAVLAVAIIGVSGGFGGAYLAGSMLNLTNGGASEETSTSRQEQPAEDGDEVTSAVTEAYVKPETSVTDDLSTLANMATINSSREMTYEELFEARSHSIVIVSNYAQSNGSYTLAGTGSGIIITTDGYIITNAHVVSGAARVTITVTDQYSDSEEIEATLLGSDTATDIAVLKVSRDDAFTAAPLGDSDTLAIGREVCAIGNPAGLTNTLTNGIVSGLNRYYSSSSGYELSSIQTNTAINPGNSGGALFDMYGNVVGVVNSKLVSDSVESLGFAITINEAKPVISDLINYGYVTGRPMLGITTMALNEYTAYLYGYNATGLLVTEINEDAPARRNGLQVGDVITAVNGKTVSSVANVQTILKDMSAGDKVTVTVVRVTTSDNQIGGFGGGNAQSQTVDLEIELIESKG